jgi:para-nitrobenzyl esterase
MNATFAWRGLYAVVCTALTALSIAAAGALANEPTTAATRGSGDGPFVFIDGGAVHGLAVPGVDEFLGLPYAAPPVGSLRWRPPRPPRPWKGVRDATQFGPSCPQPTQNNPDLPPGPLSEDCLYLNVYTPALRSPQGHGRPVLVWIHGGGLTLDAGRNYDGSELAGNGIVVVTINYRLGALGFLADPALSSRLGGPTGNYGLMDQQAALRWVQRNIDRFGGDPHNVTIAGQSAGGLSVLAQLVSPGSRGLFERAVIESGSFALEQQPLAQAEAAGESIAAKAGCADQTAQCLRDLPVADLVSSFPRFAIPGVIDGKVLTQSIGTALADGEFARVPILNGINHDEERIFLAGGVAVSGGTFVPVPDEPVTTDNYQTDIAAVLGVSPVKAAAIAAEYPPATYASPNVAFSTLVSDANFVCPALMVDRWTSARVPTFAYQFNDDAAPERFAPPSAVVPPVATHGSELQYLFGLPNAPFPGTLDADQEALSASMRAAWANFATSGNPSSPAIPWPPFNLSANALSFAPPEPQLDTSSASEHHCAFWVSVAPA